MEKELEAIQRQNEMAEAGENAGLDCTPPSPTTALAVAQWLVDPIEGLRTHLRVSSPSPVIFEYSKK